MTISEYLHLALTHRSDPLYLKYLSGRRVLDVGCGEGSFLLRDPANYIGIDINPVLVAQCQARGLQAHCMNALKLEFPDASFDAVRAAQVIEHFPPTEAVRFLREAVRVLRPTGYLVITTPGTRNVWNAFGHIRPYPPAAFHKLLRRGTEQYLTANEGIIPLKIEHVQGQRWYFSNRVATFLGSIFDLLVTPQDPIGWTIVLKKEGASIAQSDL